MKQLILGLAGLALIASADVASAKTAHHKVYGNDSLVQRNVSLPQSGQWQSGQAQSGYHPNADLKYGPQPDYPQSPAGGGY